MLRLHYLTRYIMLVALLLTGAWGVQFYVDKTLSPMQRWAEFSPWLGPAPSVPACHRLGYLHFIFTFDTTSEWIDATAEAFECSPAEPTPEQRELLNPAVPEQQWQRVFKPEKPLTMLRGNSESGYAIEDMLIAETTEGRGLLYLQLRETPPHSGCVMPPRFRDLHATMTRGQEIALVISFFSWLGILLLLPPATLLLFRAFRFAGLRQRLLWYGSSPLIILLFGIYTAINMGPSIGAWVCLALTLLALLPAFFFMVCLRSAAECICRE